MQCFPEEMGWERGVFSIHHVTWSSHIMFHYCDLPAQSENLKENLLLFPSRGLIPPNLPLWSHHNPQKITKTHRHSGDLSAICRMWNLISTCSSATRNLETGKYEPWFSPETDFFINMRANQGVSGHRVAVLVHVKLWHSYLFLVLGSSVILPSPPKSERLRLLFLQLLRVVVLWLCSQPADKTSKPKHTPPPYTYRNKRMHTKYEN